MVVATLIHGERIWCLHGIELPEYGIRLVIWKVIRVLHYEARGARYWFGMRSVIEEARLHVLLLSKGLSKATAHIFGCGLSFGW